MIAPATEPLLFFGKTQCHGQLVLLIVVSGWKLWLCSAT
jgi:hypothetical protein